MLKLIVDSVETYLETSRLVLLFGFLVFAVLLFLMSISTYVVAGAGFLNYAKLLSGFYSPIELFILFVVTLLSIVCLAFLSVGVTSVVRLKRSLDDIEFFRLIVRFPHYIVRLVVWWVALVSVTLVIVILFNAMHAPSWLSALVMLLLWAFFIFLPQSLVMHGHGLFAALKDSATFCIKNPQAIALYYILSCFLLFVLVCIDVLVGQFFISWLGAVIDSALLFMVFIPFLEIIKANLFMTRYRLFMIGLK